MTSTTKYLESVLALARTGPSEALAAVIDARLRGREDAVVVNTPVGERSITSPPLGIDEPDSNALLYEAYRHLADKADATAIERLRRACVELLMQGLGRGDDLEYLAAVGCLVGYTRVVDSESLAQQLRQQLLGFMESELPLPFHRLIELEGKYLDLATLAIDVWLAIMPVQPNWPRHLSDRVARLIDHSCAKLKDGALPLAPRLRLLSLAYSALIKLQPSLAGQRLWTLSWAVTLAGADQPALVRQWLGIWRHLGVIFSQDPAWEDAFTAGVRRISRRVLESNPAVLDLVRRSLGKLASVRATSSVPAASVTTEKPSWLPAGYILTPSLKLQRG